MIRLLFSDSFLLIQRKNQSEVEYQSDKAVVTIVRIHPNTEKALKTGASKNPENKSFEKKKLENLKHLLTLLNSDSLQLISMSLLHHRPFYKLG